MAHTSTRLALHIPDEGDTPPDIPADWQALVEPSGSGSGLDGLLAYAGTGTLAARPTSSVATPGIAGRIYLTDDQSPAQRPDFDYGTGWITLFTGGPLTATTVTATGVGSFTDGLGVIGGLVADSAAVAGNATVGGTFGVTGATTLAHVNTTGVTSTGNVVLGSGAQFSSTQVAGSLVFENFLMTGDAHYAYGITGAGVHYWGPGGAGVLDTNLYRSGVNVLRTDDSFYVGTTLTVAGAGPHNFSGPVFATYFASQTANGQVRMITSAGENWIESGNSAWTAVQNLGIGGWSSNELTLLTVNAATSTFAGEVVASGGLTTVNGGVNAVGSSGSVCLVPNAGMNWIESMNAALSGNQNFGIGGYRAGQLTEIELNAATVVMTGSATVASGLTVTGEIDCTEFTSSSNSAVGGTFGVTGATTLNSTLTVVGTATHEASITLSDAANIILGTATGTKIGTAANQKLGFYNAAPVVLPVSQGSTGIASAGSGGVTITVTNKSTFDGGLGGQDYSINDIVWALKTLGLIHA